LHPAPGFIIDPAPIEDNEVEIPALQEFLTAPGKNDLLPRFMSGIFSSWPPSMTLSRMDLKGKPAEISAQCKKL